MPAKAGIQPLKLGPRLRGGDGIVNVEAQAHVTRLSPSPPVGEGLGRGGCVAAVA